MPSAPTPLDEQTFGLGEDSVAAAVGISRKEVAGRRGPEGVRWFYGANRRILWTQGGLEALQAELAAENGAPGPAAGPGQAVETLTVLQGRLRNRRVLLAYRADPGQRITVYLGSNGDGSLFLPGMKILARPLRGAAWVFEGNPEAPERGRRMPRRIGRW